MTDLERERVERLEALLAEACVALPSGGSLRRRIHEMFFPVGQEAALIDALADALQEIADAAEADILRDDAADGRNFKESRQIKNALAALARYQALTRKKKPRTRRG